MTRDETFLIAGAGLAGARAAEALRAEGFDGRVLLVGAEAERPYARPPLSKRFLRGEVGREKVYLHEPAFYAEHDIELRLGRTVSSLDTSSGEVALDDGERLRHDRLLLATGAEPRRLSVPGSGLEYTGFARNGERVVWDVADSIERLVRERVAVDDRRLADPGIPLEALAPAEGGVA